VSESLEHQTYVRSIVEYIKKQIDEDNYFCIKADLPEYEKPSLTYGVYIPDVYYSYDKRLIIGEAKTLDDFRNEHSRKQFNAYYIECINYPFDAMIIIAVPWQLFITAKNYFRRTKRKFDKEIRVVVISENGVCEEV
jgi:hypothetical protein